MAGTLNHHNIDAVTDPETIAAAFQSPQGRAICAAVRAAMHELEDNVTVNPTSQTALRYLTIGMYAAVASLADTGG